MTEETSSEVTEKAYFQYVGDGNDAPIEFKLFGKYPCEYNGDPIEVTDPAEIAKIRGGKEFIEVTKSGKPVSPGEKEQRKEQQAAARKKRAAAKARNEAQKRAFDNEQKRLGAGDTGGDESGEVDLGD